jgi:aryl-alcohol dehydrogenase-like predicted oxidoreductase
MDYVRLGKTGMKVSRICLGCMTYGDPKGGRHAWALDDAASRPFIKRALELGINFFDTANVYSFGASEEILGRAVRDFAKRDDLVIATKVWGQMRPNDPNGGGLSRKAIFREIDESLKRLGMDYVDLYQIHHWDYNTPIEETLEALDEVVKSGRARYIGASNAASWQFAKCLLLAEMHGWTRFVCMQPHYNALYREEERELLPLCKEEGIGVIPWSPLARGRLTRAWKSEDTIRRQTDAYDKKLYDATEEQDKRVVDNVVEIAVKRGVSAAQIALAWVLHNPVVTSPIIGATKPHHLEDAAAAVSIKLTLEETQAIESAYVPHARLGV